MNTGESMSGEELAVAFRREMLGRDLSYKEVAALLGRSITTVQNILSGRDISKRTLVRAQVFVVGEKTTRDAITL